ncbi:MAG TPA: CPBP family intramembrane glutamic endopeptidase, partial [Ktedonobacterales bacterium]|nr:CPBP family intramembrane glutamic endopeptidase [Ktedonobacterales bacterium]
MSRRWVIGLTLLVSVLALGASALSSYVLSVIPPHVQTNADALAKQAQTAPLTTLGALLAAILVAPWCEEVFFRGFVFPGLLRRLPLWPTMALSAALFALAHADVGSFIPLVLLGLALAYLRWRTGSLWPCIALHTLNNLIATALLAHAFFH